MVIEPCIVETFILFDPSMSRKVRGLIFDDKLSPKLYFYRCAWTTTNFINDLNFFAYKCNNSYVFVIRWNNKYLQWLHFKEDSKTQLAIMNNLCMQKIIFGQPETYPNTNTFWVIEDTLVLKRTANLRLFLSEYTARYLFSLHSNRICIF